MRLALVSLGFLFACSDGVETGDGDGDGDGSDAAVSDNTPRTCIATSTASAEAERLDVVLEGTRPLSTDWSRGGAPYSRWTYAYDANHRLVVEEQDCCSTASSAPDGVADRARELEHAATSTIVRWVPRPAGTGATETATYTLDAGDRVTHYETASSQMTFELDAQGRLLRIDEDAVDIDLGPYTRLTEYTYSGDHLSSRRVIDSRTGPMPSMRTYTHQLSTNRVDVLVASRRYAYTYDSAERVVRAEVDEDGNGTSDWIVEATYGAEGDVTIDSTRDGTTFRTHTFSAGCDFSIDLPTGSVAWRRPGAAWAYLQPAVPNAYE